MLVGPGTLLRFIAGYYAYPRHRCSRCRQAALSGVNPADFQWGARPAQPGGSGYGRLPQM